MRQAGDAPDLSRETAALKGHFECAGYHPPFLANQFGQGYEQIRFEFPASSGISAVGLGAQGALPPNCHSETRSDEEAGAGHRPVSVKPPPQTPRGVYPELPRRARSDTLRAILEAWPAQGETCSNHQRAMSTRRANHTPGSPLAYWRNRSTAMDRAGLPVIRQCRPTDIIFGWVRPSS